MKKSIIYVTGFAVTAALLFIGCEDSASQNKQGYVDGFLVEVNQKPGTGTGDGETGVYTVTVISEGDGATKSRNYPVNMTVDINAGTIVGRSFERWTTTSPGVKFAHADSASTTFDMPANDVTVTAVFWICSDCGDLIDKRDNKKYKTTVIGGRTWMAENLNYDTANGVGSWCYDNNPDNCNIYGRLYDWNTAMTVCMAGYHLPTRQEWDNLVAAAGGDSAGNKLKAKNGWIENGGKTRNGTDEFGFSAVPGGCYYSGINDFWFIGYVGFWWTSTEWLETWTDDGIDYKNEGIEIRLMNLSDKVQGDREYGDTRMNRLSVRCVKTD